MRVLNDRVLVTVYQNPKDLLIRDIKSIRKGTVESSGVEGLNPGDDVLFGDQIEIIDTDFGKPGEKHILMYSENIKIIYDGNDPTPEAGEGRVLPFFKEKAI
jgi:hypothetical protein